MSDLISFEDKLDNSLQRDLVKIEHVRMRVAHEGALQELADTELIELKFIFDRSKYFSLHKNPYSLSLNQFICL